MDHELPPDDQLSYDEREERLARIIASYSDRLNEGMAFDVDATIAANLDLADDLAMAFDALGQVISSKRDDDVLGTIGDYTLRRQIARGGMGVVYELDRPRGGPQGVTSGHCGGRQGVLEVLPGGEAGGQADASEHRSRVRHGHQG